MTKTMLKSKPEEGVPESKTCGNCCNLIVAASGRGTCIASQFLVAKGIPSYVTPANPHADIKEYLTGEKCPYWNERSVAVVVQVPWTDLVKAATVGPSALFDADQIVHNGVSASLAQEGEAPGTVWRHVQAEVRREAKEKTGAKGNGK